MRTYANIIALILTCVASTSHAAPPRADDIIDKAYRIERVDDQIATLNFTFSAPGKAKQEVIYTMVWKNMAGRDGYDNKAIFFTEYPPEKRGVAYLGWLRRPGSTAKDDEWIYLPELRMTRRIAHRDHAHAHDDDEFGNSLLKREHLDPRPPELDHHRLIGEEILEGRPHYLIASIPKQAAAQMPGMPHQSGKVIRWIDTESFLTRRLQFFEQHGQEVLSMRIDWVEKDGYWLWRRVMATDPRTLANTVLEISDIRINTDLDDRTFTKRVLEKGAERLR